MDDFPEHMRIGESTQFDVAIPGWHINGHGDACRSNFNLSYMEGAGRTVGEDIETTWAGTNQLAPSVREMGPAARHDTLNDQWNGWNFRKIVGFRMFFFLCLFIIHIYTRLLPGSLFLKRLKEAFRMSTQQANIFNQFSATFSPTTVKKWEAMVIAWNTDTTAPNPYQEPRSGEILCYRGFMAFFLMLFKERHYKTFVCCWLRKKLHRSRLGNFLDTRSACQRFC